MNVKDIPQDMIDQLRSNFDSTPEVCQIRTRQQYLQRTGKFQEALELAKTLETLFSSYLYSYMDKAEKEAIVFDSETSNLPEKDKEEMFEKLTVLFMACDVIKAAVQDLNSILHRTKSDINITAFDDIMNLSEIADQKLMYLQKNGDLMNDLAWGDRCDNMYDMMISKARSLINKRKNSKDWGENMKKYG